jgi:glycosyltransferase involved in cell wall biosynthesis
MHVLFVHKNFPAQFGHIGSYLVKKEGFRCTFVSELPDNHVGGIRLIKYKTRGGATQSVHYCSRTFENCTWHAHAVYEAMKAHAEVKPDLVVGHSGFGSTLFLADLYDCPIINYFEYYYRGRNSDMDFRPEFATSELDVLRARTRNAMILCDLQNCAAGYSPTEWQRSLFPKEYQYKIRAIFDGIDRDFWYRRDTPRRVADREIPAGTRIVTYVSRGFEAMRGFDIFMKVAHRICQARTNVLFVVVGSDRVCYGGDLKHIKAKTFREHVLSQDQYDLNRFVFTGQIPAQQLVELLSASDLHIYLTVPFVLSWSLMDALACGCTVLASDTAPVREVIRHEETGLLAGFYDIDELVRQALRVLDAPDEFKPLGQAGVRLIDEKYSLAKKLPEMLQLYEDTVSAWPRRDVAEKGSGVFFGQ